MDETRTLLSKYFDILEDNGTAKYLQCKSIPISFKNSDSTDILWKKHDKSIQNEKLYDIEPKHRRWP